MNDPKSISFLLNQLLDNALASSFAELEVKFCAVKNGNFTNGISKSEFDALFAWLSSSTCWRDVRHNEYVDYSFKNHIRGSGGLFDDRTHFITKKTRRHVDFSCTPQLGIRASLKTEVPTSLGLGRDIGTYESVRVKQRSSFVYKCWSFDLTRVWTGANPVAALCSKPHSASDLLNLKLPLTRDREPDSYEVELEFLPRWKGEDQESSQLLDSFLLRIREIATRLGFSPDKDTFRLMRDINFESEVKKP